MYNYMHSAPHLVLLFSCIVMHPPPSFLRICPTLLVPVTMFSLCIYPKGLFVSVSFNIFVLN